MSRETGKDQRRAGRRRWTRGGVLLIAAELLVLVGLLGALWYRWQVKQARQAARVAIEEHLGPVRPGEYKMEWVPGHRNAFTWLTAGSAAVPVPDTTERLEELRSLADRPAGDWPSEAAIEELMAASGPALELLHAATRQTELGLGIDYSRGHETQVPNLISFVQAARVLVAHARWSLSRGDEEAALASIRSLALLARGLEQEPLLITKTVGASVERRLHRAVAEWISSPPGPPAPAETLAELDRLLAELPRPIGYPRALGFEAASTLQVLEPEQLGRPKWRVRYLGPFCMSELALRYAEVGRRASEPFVHTRADLWSEEGFLGSAERRRSWVGRLCEPELRLLSGGPDLLARMELTEAGRRLLRLGLQLAAGAGRGGGYPGDLRAFAAAPDPMTGELPRYELRPDGTATVSYEAAGAVAEELEEFGVRRRSMRPPHLLRLELPAPQPREPAE